MLTNGSSNERSNPPEPMVRPILGDDCGSEAARGVDGAKGVGDENKVGNNHGKSNLPRSQGLEPSIRLSVHEIVTFNPEISVHIRKQNLCFHVTDAPLVFHSQRTHKRIQRNLLRNKMDTYGNMYVVQAAAAVKGEQEDGHQE